MSKAPGTLVLLAVSALLFWRAAVLQQDLAAQRKAFLPGVAEVTESMPPLVVFTTVALGGFRGLIADALWLRSTRMQEEGRYFELVQLADWITKLEPRFTPAWAFHGWNMAYNVSVLFDDPVDRWRWVQSGIRLLRDEGIPNNPGAAPLYWELGWLYQHKVGQDMDQAHFYYKIQLATEMSRLFNGRAPDFETLRTAATSVAELQARPGVAALMAEGKAAGIDLLDLLALDPEEVPAMLTTRILETKPGAELLHYLQRRQLEGPYHLDLEAMRRVDEEYGPLDWRLPQAHALYWAQRGLPHAAGFEKVKLERMTFQAMADAFRQGSAFVDVEGNLIPSPNLEVLPHVRLAYARALEANPDTDAMKTAHFNFLNEAMAILYAYNHIGKAKELFADMQARYPDRVGTDPFNVFLIRQIAEDMEAMSSSQAGSFVEGLWGQSYMWYAMGDEARSAGSAELANTVYQTYQATLSEGEHKERMGLPPQSVIRDQAYQRLMMEIPSEPLRARLRALRPGVEVESP